MREGECVCVFVCVCISIDTDMLHTFGKADAGMEEWQGR